MANILMLINQFSNVGEAADPPHQLADAFVAAGHSVKAVVIPWQRSEKRVSRYTENDALEVLRVPPLDFPYLGRAVAMLCKWAFSSLIALFHARKFLRNEKFDIIYSTSPAVSMGFLTYWAIRKFRALSYLYVVDFFPFHQRAIGVVPDGLIFRFAKSRETSLIQMFDVIACMTPKNIEFLRKNYALRNGQSIEILPLSTGIAPFVEPDKDAVRAQYELPIDKVIAIFGGQITEGRGIEQIIETASLAGTEARGLHFVLAGGGRLAPLVEAYIADGGSNLSLISSLGRDEYLKLASACDIGLIVTVPIHDIPTFPSKTLDYLQASLPVVAAVEAGTDFREFVNEHGFGIVVEAGNAGVLLNALTKLANDPAMRGAMASAGRKTLEDVFDVRIAANRVCYNAQISNP